MFGGVNLSSSRQEKQLQASQERIGELSRALQAQRERRKRERESGTDPRAAAAEVVDGEYDWTRAYSYWDVFEDEGEMEEQLERERQRVRQIAEHQTAAVHGHDHHVERELFELPFAEQLRHMRRFVRNGTAFAREGQTVLALREFHMALIYYEYMFPDDEEDSAIVEGLRVRAATASAAASVRQNQFLDAVDFARQALASDPDHVKALYWRAQAYRRLNRLDEAHEDLQHARRVAAAAAAAAAVATTAAQSSTSTSTPASESESVSVVEQLRSIHMEQQRLTRARKRYQRARKNMTARMFGGRGAKSKTAAPTPAPQQTKEEQKGGGDSAVSDDEDTDVAPSTTTTNLLSLRQRRLHHRPGEEPVCAPGATTDAGAQMYIAPVHDPANIFQPCRPTFLDLHGHDISAAADGAQAAEALPSTTHTIQRLLRLMSAGKGNMS